MMPRVPNKSKVMLAIAEVWLNVWNNLPTQNHNSDGLIEDGKMIKIQIKKTFLNPSKEEATAQHKQ